MHCRAFNKYDKKNHSQVYFQTVAFPFLRTIKVRLGLVSIEHLDYEVRLGFLAFKQTGAILQLIL